jgi:hypothetical protein
MHAFLFCANKRGAGGVPDRLVGHAGRWVEPVCRGGRPELPLTIESSGLPLYLPYIYIWTIWFIIRHCSHGNLPNHHMINNNTAVPQTYYVYILYFSSPHIIANRV